MIERLIEWCARNRFLVFTGTAVLRRWGVWAMGAMPVDAVPDISDVQVIVSTEWPGRSPDLIEDQVTYPIVSALLSAPRVSTVRGFTDFGISYVYVIFEDGTDIYWARSRVVEYLQGIRGQLPEGVIADHGPDATGVGWVFEYALVDETGQHTWRTCAASRTGICATGWRPSGRRRGRQHRRLCQAVPGQPGSDPAGRLRHRRQGLVDAIRASNNDVEGRLLEFAGREYMVRGRGYLTSSRTSRRCRSVRTRAARRSASATWRGCSSGRISAAASPSSTATAKSSAASSSCGSARTRWRVIDRVKAKLRELQSALPAGVHDRADLRPLGAHRRLDRDAARTLIEEAIIVSLVILVFLLHVRSALVPILTLPIAVVARSSRCATSASPPTSCRSAGSPWPSACSWMRRS